MVYPLGFCRFRKRTLGKAAGFRPRTNRGFSPFQREQKTPAKGVFWCTRWGFAVSVNGPSARRRAFALARTVASRLSNGNKKTPIRGVLVYPLGFCRFRKRTLGKASGFRPRTNRGFSPFHRKQKNTRKGVFWCTRWGLNPNSTASEAVMLSSYTTGTHIYALFQSYSILLFFICFLQAFMVYYF